MRTRTMVGTAAVAAMALLASACSGGSDGTDRGDHLHGGSGGVGRGDRRRRRLGPPGPRLRQQPGRGVDHRRHQRAQPRRGLEPRGVRQPLDRAPDRRAIRSTCRTAAVASPRSTATTARSDGRPRRTGSTSGRSASRSPTVASRHARLDGSRRGRRAPRGGAVGRDIIATPSTGVDIQPTVFDGTVFVSTVPISLGGIYNGGDRGIIHALDAATGEVRWTFDTVDSPDLWGNPEVNSGGGAWYPPSIDVQRGVVYWGIANPAPFPGTPEFPNGSSRPGPNLYTDSAVALEVTPASSAGTTRSRPTTCSTATWSTRLIAHLENGDDVVIATGKGGGWSASIRTTARCCGRRRSGITRTTTSPSSTGPPPSHPAPSAASSHRPPPPTASSTSPRSTRRSTLEPNATAYFGAEPGQFDGAVVGGRRHDRRRAVVDDGPRRSVRGRGGRERPGAHRHGAGHALRSRPGQRRHRVAGDAARRRQRLDDGPPATCSSCRSATPRRRRWWPSASAERPGRCRPETDLRWSGRSPILAR